MYLTINSWSGISRCTAFAAAYLMYKLATPIDDSILLVRRAKFNVYPNPGFINQLKNYEKELKKARFEKDQRTRYNFDYTSVSQ